nr:tumor susceptibility gene 101 protein-like isoform X2 [Crassostrea gigas]
MTSADQILKDALSKYKYADIARRDVTNAISQFKDLLPSLDSFLFNDGNRKELLILQGTIPVTFKGSIYNIPIGIWILDTHPYNPPMVFIKPTSTMPIKPGRNVDTNGKVDLPYLRDWRYILILVFGEEPPIVCKPQQLDQSYTPRLYPSSSSSTSSIPYLPYPTTFRYPVSTSQFANSGPGQYHVSAPQCDTSEAKTPTSMKGFDLGTFQQTMRRFALDEFVKILVEHGVDCLETFCSMTESD